jgi:hypothetical protein
MKNKLGAKDIIAIIIITIFMVVTALIAFYSYANDYQGGSEITADHLKNYFALFSGTIGIILGYYFGKEKSKS